MNDLEDLSIYLFIFLLSASFRKDVAETYIEKNLFFLLLFFIFLSLFSMFFYLYDFFLDITSFLFILSFFST